MCLETDAVDFDTGILDELHDAPRARCFGPAVFEVVVVVVELCGGICRGCGGECDGEVCFADCCVEDVCPVGAVFV
jgi:hypothetical protein